MNSPADKPTIKLSYRPPSDEPTGPSMLRIFAGLFCSCLCLVPFMAALLFLWLAFSAFLGFKPFGQKSGQPVPISVGMGLLFGTVMCAFPTYIMFQMARRLFQGKQMPQNQPDEIETMIYQHVDEVSQVDVAAAIERDQPDELLLIPIAVSLHSLDFEWAQSVCIRLASHPHFNVRGNAVLGFGHLARRFRRLDEVVVKPIIEAGLFDPEKYVQGQASAAADDVVHFLGWKLAGHEGE